MEYSLGGISMIISFAWTTDAVTAGIKTVTRRDWQDKTAAKFKAGDIADAYNKLPRAGGRLIGKIRITRDPYKQKLKDMPMDHFWREGGYLYWKSIDEFLKMMGGDGRCLRERLDREYWVIEFELVEEEK